ncbi:hypothetical protein D3C71_344000 [compost metagenome]
MRIDYEKIATIPKFIIQFNFGDLTSFHFVSFNPYEYYKNDRHLIGVWRIKYNAEIKPQN